MQGPTGGKIIILTEYAVPKPLWNIYKHPNYSCHFMENFLFREENFNFFTIPEDLICTFYRTVSKSRFERKKNISHISHTLFTVPRLSLPHQLGRKYKYIKGFKCAYKILLIFGLCP
jgi:hypothetical protein